MNVIALTLLFVMMFGSLTKEGEGGNCNAPCEQEVYTIFHQGWRYECTHTVCPCEGTDETECVVIEPE